MPAGVDGSQRPTIRRRPSTPSGPSSSLRRPGAPFSDRPALRFYSGHHNTALEQDERGWQYILGARMRSQNEVKDEVLARAGRYRIVHPPRVQSDAPSPLKVKEVWVDERRYVVCLNEDEARKDAADREAIVAALREQLR